jgi:hypothetical protein
MLYFIDTVENLSTWQKQAMRERMVCTIIQPKITILQFNNRPRSTKRPNEVTTEDFKNLMSIIMSGGHTMGGQVNASIRRTLTFKYLDHYLHVTVTLFLMTTSRGGAIYIAEPHAWIAMRS